MRPHIGETHVIKQILDLGCQTLIVPMVESGEQAEMLVRSMRYPPHGIRGVGGAGARVTRFSKDSDYLSTADEEMCLVVQVENQQVSTRWMIFCWSTGSMRSSSALRTSAQISDISEIPVRPRSLPLSMRARQDRRVRQGVRHHGARSGGGKAIDRGVDFVAVSIDARTLALSLRALAAEMRDR